MVQVLRRPFSWVNNIFMAGCPVSLTMILTKSDLNQLNYYNNRNLNNNDGELFIECFEHRKNSGKVSILEQLNCLLTYAICAFANGYSTEKRGRIFRVLAIHWQWLLYKQELLALCSHPCVDLTVEELFSLMDFLEALVVTYNDVFGAAISDVLIPLSGEPRIVDSDVTINGDGYQFDNLEDMPEQVVPESGVTNAGSVHVQYLTEAKFSNSAVEINDDLPYSPPTYSMDIDSDMGLNGGDSLMEVFSFLFCEPTETTVR